MRSAQARSVPPHVAALESHDADDARMLVLMGHNALADATVSKRLLLLMEHNALADVTTIALAHVTGLSDSCGR